MTTIALDRELTISDLPEQVAAWPRYELIDGSLTVSPSPGLRHQAIVAAIYDALRASVPGDARVLPGANVMPHEKTLVIPDVLVVRRARVARGGLGVEPQEVLLAVEVESDSTRRRDRTLKRTLYEEWSVPYLLVNPATETTERFGDVPDWPVDLRAIFDD